MGQETPSESHREATPLPSFPTLDISSLNQRDALPERDKKEEVTEADVDIEVEEPKSHDLALQVQEEEKDFLKVLEGWREKVVATREWQELEPRTVLTVEAFKGLEDEAELSF